MNGELNADHGRPIAGRHRRVGLAEDLPEEWIDAVRNTAVPEDAAGADDPPSPRTE